MSRGVVIKCWVCNKVRVPGKGVCEKIFGTQFSVAVTEEVPMCDQCRKAILRAAFDGGTIHYHILYGD